MTLVPSSSSPPFACSGTVSLPPPPPPPPPPPVEAGGDDEEGSKMKAHTRAFLGRKKAHFLCRRKIKEGGATGKTCLKHKMGRRKKRD